MNTANLNVTSEFLQCLSRSETFPLNIPDQRLYGGTLKAYRARLVEAFDRLCVVPDSGTDVPFHDLCISQQPTQDGGERQIESFRTENVCGLSKLQQHLGITYVTPNSSSSQQMIAVTKSDPKCRFIFLCGKHSKARLNITKAMLLELLTYHQVMPSYLDFLLLFGQHSGPKDLRFGGFREQTVFEASVSGDLNSLGRSGKYFEMCYNLKSAGSLKNRPEAAEFPWSVRHAAIYHRFDVTHGTALWLITRGSKDLKEQVQEVTGPDGRPQDRTYRDVSDSFRSSCAIHLMCLHWAAESWRWYIQFLEEEIDKKTEDAAYGTRDKAAKYRKIYTARDLQTVQTLEDRINETTMFIDSNIDVIASLTGYYLNLAADDHFPLKGTCARLIGDFIKQVKSVMYDLKMQSARANSVARHANGRKNLILQHLQAQTAENMEGLTISTFRVGLSAQKEAIVVRIIAIVTMIFLPATFVSTFFSTDVVKYQDHGQTQSPSSAIPGEGASFSNTAMYRWLQVTLPLTAVTMTVAFSWYYWERRQLLRKQVFEISF